MSYKLSLPLPPKIIADSYSPFTDSRLVTFIVTMPTCLLAELRTHRLLLSGMDNEFSVNANSDRAIPIKKRVEDVLKNPYTPIPSLANKGMTANEDVSNQFGDSLQEEYVRAFKSTWPHIAILEGMGASKQFTNRLLMPWAWSTVVVTATAEGWASFFKLRVAPDVEPNFRFIASEMQKDFNSSLPKVLQPGEWHIAFDTEEYPEVYKEKDLIKKLIISGSYCARISYDIERDEPFDKHLSRFKMCADSLHTSISEHQAKVPTLLDSAHMEIKVVSDSKEGLMQMRFSRGKYVSNLLGWVPLRKIVECGEFEYPEVSNG